MDVRNLILRKLEENGEVRASEIVDATGYSRAYVNRFFRELREEGILTLTGKANRARYIPATEQRISREKDSITKDRRILVNSGLNEDEVFSDIRKKTCIVTALSDNVSGILEYAFSEMLNNAIEHSNSKKIEIKIEKKPWNIIFEVRDRGIGIFNNIMNKKQLNSEMDAIRELLKGKQTTAPSEHSGEGIFFTSRAADILAIQSSRKKLVFDNHVEDIFLRDVTYTEGTKVKFSISLDSTRNLESIFRRYTDDLFEFSKTEVTVKLYEEKSNYVSRSQARRLVTGLEKFKKVTLDFSGVGTIGQAFADEIFRVWGSKHPDVSIDSHNASENVEFMIKRARSGQ